MNMLRIMLVGLIVAAASCFAQDEERNDRPAISHDPVKVAIRGQPVTVLARVTDDSGLVKSVTLFTPRRRMPRRSAFR